MKDYMLVNLEKVKSDVILFARDKQGKKKTFRVKYEPYFYVPSTDTTSSKMIKRIEYVNYKDEHGNSLKKVFTWLPEQVPKVRENFSKHFEADVNYVIRFRIDLGLKEWFRAPESKYRITPEEIEPWN